MQNLLNDIELDIQELKCLVQAISNEANPALRAVAKRNIQQMQLRLDALSKMLDESIIPVSPPQPILCAKEVPAAQPIPSYEPTANASAPLQPVASLQSSSILGEKIKSATDLRHAISLNDSFRFTREIFEGDSLRMNQIVHRLGAASSFDEAMNIFIEVGHLNEENQATADFIELLKKHFS